MPSMLCAQHSSAVLVNMDSLAPSNDGGAAGIVKVILFVVACLTYVIVCHCLPSENLLLTKSSCWTVCALRWVAGHLSTDTHCLCCLLFVFAVLAQ